MSPDAHPYTPTRFRGTPTSGNAPQFPSAPSAATAGTAAPGKSPTGADATASSSAPPAAAAAASGASGNASVTATPSKADAAAALPKYISEKPFATSSLQPTPGTEVTVAPEEIPKFDCTWTLYADDHANRSTISIGGGGGAPQSNDASYNPVEVRAVTTIADFWRLWRNLPPPSNLPTMSNFTYYWFRRDIKPSWEDERNKNGGTITIMVYDKDMPKLMDRQAAEDAFMATICLLTGESLPEAAGVNGVVLKLRKSKWTMQLWTSGSTKSSQQALYDVLKKELLKVLPAEVLTNVPFAPHNAAAAPTPAAAKRPKGGKPVPPKTVLKIEPTHHLS